MNHRSVERMPPHTALIFIHIPKAAGTTLHEIVSRQFPREATFTIDGAHVRRSIEEFKGLPQEERERIRCLKGHMPFGLHSHFPVPATYITLLRDPVERIISHYYYVLRQPKHYLHDEVARKNMTLDEYVRSGLSPELTNGQTRLVSGIEKVDSVAGTEPVTADVLQAAKTNLHHYFAAVGLSEKFDESLLLFRRLFGWRNIFYLPQNVTEGRPLRQQITTDALGAIQSNNRFDLELYDFAKQRFGQLVAEEGPAFQAEVHAFAILNRAYGAAWRANGVRLRGMRRVRRLVREPGDGLTMSP
jgi:hypothetical protein